MEEYQVAQFPYGWTWVLIDLIDGECIDKGDNYYPHRERAELDAEELSKLTSKKFYGK